MTAAKPCTHLYALHESRGVQSVRCLGCGQEKPPEPCYFADKGEADRKALEQRAK